MVGAVRFELTTSCTRNKRASQATLRPDPFYTLLKILTLAIQKCGGLAYCQAGGASSMSGEEYPVGLYCKPCGSMGSEGMGKGEITESSAIVGMLPSTCVESGLNLKWEAWYVFGKRMICGLKVEESVPRTTSCHVLPSSLSSVTKSLMSPRRNLSF